MSGPDFKAPGGKLPRHKPFWRRALQALLTFALTGIIIALAATLVIAGRSTIAERAEAAAPPAETKAMAVRTQTVRFEDGYTAERRFAGQVEAAQDGAFGFETGGTVEAVLVDEGDSVARGDVLARLDTRLIEAERARLGASKRALEAQVELARRTEARQRELNTRGFASDQVLDQVALSLAEAEARIAEVEAGLLAVDIQLEKAVLRAGFDGTVSTRHLDPGVSVGAGQPVVTLLQNARPQFRAGIAPTLAAALKPGAEAVIRIGRQDHAARVASTLPGLDPVTRTRTVLLDFADGPVPPFGTVGEVVIADRVAERGAWLPTSALLDAPRGLWQVRTVENGVTGSESVEVLHATSDRVYVRGTFKEGAEVIVDGPHRIVAGQDVRVLAEAE